MRVSLGQTLKRCGLALLFFSFSFSPVHAETSESNLRNLFQEHQASKGIILVQLQRNTSRRSILLIDPSLERSNLTKDFFEAKDPSLSLDGNTLLFSGRKTAESPWQIYEKNLKTKDIRRITKCRSDCTQPLYLSQMYVITSVEPWKQIAFVKVRNGVPNLWTILPNGKNPRQITFNPDGVMDSFLLSDGRILFSAWQKNRFGAIGNDRLALFAINMDGTDLQIFSGDEGRSLKRGARMNSSGKILMIEGRDSLNASRGSIASLDFRRNLHSYKNLTDPQKGVFQTPSPLPGLTWLVSKKEAEKFGIHRFQPETGETKLLFKLPKSDLYDAQLVIPREEPDGRSSIVKDSVKTGRFYGLNLYTSDIPIKKGSIHQIRVLKRKPGETKSVVLGNAPVYPDGSFNIIVPAETSLQLQALDQKGNVVRSCKWIWVMKNEPRGCIGCHEDGERTPENRMAEALRYSSHELKREKPGKKLRSSE